jgi:hypothetical protein
MWNLNSEERLREWKSFRKNIGNLELESALKSVTHLWSYAPYVTHYLSEDQFEEWPDPWTLIYENHYCDLAKALGMLYTVYLCHHYKQNINQLELRVYKNTENSDMVNVVWINRGKYILNLMFDTVVNKNLVNEKYQLKHKYNVNDLKLDLY